MLRGVKAEPGAPAAAISVEPLSKRRQVLWMQTGLYPIELAARCVSACFLQLKVAYQD